MGKFNRITRDNIEVGDVFLTQYLHKNSDMSDDSFDKYVVTETEVGGGKHLFSVRKSDSRVIQHLSYFCMEGTEPLGYEAILIKRKGEVLFSKTLADKLERVTIFQAPEKIDFGKLRPRQTTLSGGGSASGPA